MQLQLVYRELFDRMFERVEREILLHFPQRKDAHNTSHFVREKLRHIVADLDDEMRGINVSLTTIATAVDGKARRGLETQLGATLTRIGLRNAPGVGGLIDGFRRANLDKIRSLVDTQVSELQEILSNAEASGARVEEIRKSIVERFDVSKSHADLLARDQTLKLAGQLTETRQRQAGIEEYVWSTSGDERVREMHDELDGTVQRWDDPPVTDEDGSTNHPGGDFQCRCVAIPVLPEIEEQP